MGKLFNDDDLEAIFKYASEKDGVLWKCIEQELGDEWQLSDRFIKEQPNCTTLYDSNNNAISIVYNAANGNENLNLVLSKNIDLPSTEYGIIRYVDYSKWITWLMCCRQEEVERVSLEQIGIGVTHPSKKDTSSEEFISSEVYLKFAKEISKNYQGKFEKLFVYLIKEWEDAGVWEVSKKTGCIKITNRKMVGILVGMMNREYRIPENDLSPLFTVKKGDSEEHLQNFRKIIIQPENIDPIIGKSDDKISFKDMKEKELYDDLLKKFDEVFPHTHKSKQQID